VDLPERRIAESDAKFFAGNIAGKIKVLSRDVANYSHFHKTALK